MQTVGGDSDGATAVTCKRYLGTAVIKLKFARTLAGSKVVQQLSASREREADDITGVETMDPLGVI